MKLSFYKTLIGKTLAIASVAVIHQSAFALDSDKDQPVSINADNVDYNFATGARTYEGNVVLIQGSLKVESNKLVATFDGDKFDKAVATGTADKRARFQQRPEGKDDDVVGIGDTLIYNESEQKMEIIDNAELMQANQKATGRKIVYDITKEKMNVTGGGVEHATAKANSSAKVNNSNGRSKLVVSSKERQDNTDASGAAPTDGLDGLKEGLNGLNAIQSGAAEAVEGVVQ